VRRLVSVGLGVALLTGGLLAPTAAVAGGDRPDTLRAAKQAAASPAGKRVHDTLSSATDRDWFKFRVPADQRVLITLGHLPADYALAVYTGSGHRVALADRSGRRFEQLYVPLSKGNAYVRVSASGSTVDPAVNYTLIFRPLPTAVVFAERKGTLGADGLDVRGELLNNTSHRVTIQRLRTTFYDKNGGKLGSFDEGVRPGPVRARHRVEFEIQRSAQQVPSGATRYRLRVAAVSTSHPALGGIKMSPDATVDFSSTKRVYSGTIKNTTDHTITNVYPTVIEYDSLGRANTIGYGLVKSIAAGASKHYSFTVGGNGVPKPNAVRQYPTIVDDL
jgi:hypothetical protein